MQPKWLNDGEPDENGDIIAVIENNAGARVSTFKGKTVREVADKILNSQASANREIVRLRRPDRAAVPEAINPKDTALNPTDRMRLADELSRPETVVEAVTELMTAANGGIAPRAATRNLATMTDGQQQAYYREEAEAFIRDNPDYYPVQQNRDKLFAELKKSGWDLTRNNLGIIFQTLFDQNEMILWPEGENEGAPNGQLPPDEPTNGQQREASPPPSPTNGNSRPRSVSTGIRSRDASATPPPPRPAPKLTRAMIEAMPRAEYNHRLQNEPGFRKAVDSL